ncbi:hypothetical protein ACJIZ3_004331 [Penstemon smallii]|uniref:Uncharacterized protein n=1 Tax=Penstemon smallii TaxID=265156 RepID=A0ABD3S1Y6_9LAMI
MLGLIAFSLLILACSYWKLSDQVNGGEGVDVEKGENNSDTKSLPFSEENFLVIMAGEVKPSYLATPMTSSSKASNSFNDDEKVDNYEEEDTIKEKDETTGGGESK